MTESAVRWVRWWCAAWQNAHPDWQAQAALVQQAASCPHSRHALLSQAHGIVATQPPPPHQGLLQWLDLAESQRQRALQLARQICAAAPCEQTATQDADSDWCRSLGKALRPGLWLPTTALDPRLLLGAWAGPLCWSRLCLQWPPEALDTPPQELPAKRLDTLWSAILWRVTQAEPVHAD